MDWYRGKKVFISGGTKGIGRATAIRLAGVGADVVVAARGQAGLDETLASMRSAGPKGTFGAISVDVTDRQAVTAAAQEALALLGGMDVLICNTGYALTGLTHEAEDDAYEKMMAVNFMGHVHVVRALVDHFREQGSGDICLVSSMLGFMSMYGYGAYSASKFAIVGFAQALRQELTLEGVRVTVFYPPTTKTPGLDKENESKPPVVWALEADNGWNKTYEAEEVADGLLASIKKGKFEGVIGADSWFIHTVNRVLPGITRWIFDGDLRKAVAKVAVGKVEDGTSPST
jgi:3-dehydrosphinganine reductase